MWPKYVLVMLLVALCPGKTKADTSIILQDFEQIIFEFFEKYSNNTSDDICKASVPEIIINKESFENSKFYKQYVADHFKSEEKQCSTVKYELGELQEVKIDKRIAEEIEDTYTSTTTTSNENKETTSETSTGKRLEKTEIRDKTTESGQETTRSGQKITESVYGTSESSIWENTNGTTSKNEIEDTYTSTTTTSNDNEETSPATDTNTGKRLEKTEIRQTTTESGQETTRSGQKITESVHGTAESNKWENTIGTTSKNGTKTTVIVVSTIAAVAATSAAAFYGVPWIKTILQSGSYRFPTTPGV